MLGEDPGVADRLLTPSVAIDLGTALLGKNRAELGAIGLAAAAYNGGADSVVKWMRRFGELPVDLFIERIPFHETRNYVKRVLAVEAMYRALDGTPLVLDLPTPEVLRAPPSSVTHFGLDTDGGG